MGQQAAEVRLAFAETPELAEAAASGLVVGELIEGVSRVEGAARAHQAGVDELRQFRLGALDRVEAERACQERRVGGCAVELAQKVEEVVLREVVHVVA